MAQFQVEAQQLVTASGKLAEYANQYRQYAKQLFDAASTMGAAWEGEDNKSFVTQINGLTDDLENMAKKMDNASQTLKQQATNYQQKQDANTSGVKSLKN